jgi:DNA-binding Lrp family transcriptional regulator
VDSVVEVAGQYDISAVVAGEDIRSVNESIDAIREVEGVQSTNTLFVLRSWK